MEIILRVLQVFLAVGLIGVVLLQRSEGGGLGIGSSGGAGSFMSVRGTANFLTRVTAILAALFMITCLTLALLAKPKTAPKSIFDSPTPTSTIPAPTAPAPAAPMPTAPPASDAPLLPAPVPGEGVTTTPPQSLTPPVAPAPAAEAPAPVTAPPPAAAAPVAPEVKPAAPAAKAKPKKAPQTGTAHTTGQ
ncbi:MAG: protein translocase subunit secG [Rhodospirillales bacterium]|nr:protein translocase subunit secG [Rhodospirillales bacterium]